MQNSRIELLSPAKNKQIAFAAIDCGADAVYIGAPAFGARKSVPNSIEDIEEVINYAHKFWAKVYIALNTILTDEELEDAIAMVKKLDKLGADALIIQDLGLLNKLIELKLNIPIHMSTQCDNYLAEKIKFFNKIGVSRVILARELSLDEINKIHKENPSLELESFVHGALCVSMSGQCYLSQYIGGRSANRGECAQPCRKIYDIETEDGKILKKGVHALCLKDFNASNLLTEMIHAGITSFKIEGRLKDIGYVKNITAFYSNKLKNRTSSGKSIYPFTPNPEKSFNRGFTEYFLKGRSDCFNFESPKSIGEYLGVVIDVKKNCFKIKTKKKLSPQDGLYYEKNGFLVNKIEQGWIYPNKPIQIKVGTKVYRNQDVEFEKELDKPVKRQIEANIIIKNYITITDEDDISVAINLPSGDEAKDINKNKENYIKQLSKTGDSEFFISEVKILSEIPFLPISKINEIRRNLLEALSKKRIETYNSQIKQKQKKMTYTKYYSEKLDYRANIHNTSAVDFYKKCGVKEFEPSFESKKPSRQIELMRCKHCIKYALNLCKTPQNLVLKDEYGKFYPLKFNCKNCEMSVLSPEA